MTIESRDTTQEGFPILRIAAVFIRRRRLLLLSPVVGALLFGANTFLRPRHYLASGSFVPQATSREMSPLAGLAAQYGVAIPGSDNTQSPAFYASLLESDELLETVASQRYTVPMNGQIVAGDLAEIFEIKEPTHRATVLATIKTLKRMLTTRVTRQTGIVQITVESSSDSLAVLLASRFIAQINGFNLNQRKSQAGQERQFLEARRESARGELAVAEGRLESFMQNNRLYQDSPPLMFQFERLKREVDLRQNVFAQLQQSFERAKLDEIRDTPVITVIDHPKSAPKGKGTILATVLGAIVGALFGLGIALLAEVFSNGVLRDRPDYVELTAEANRAGGVIRRLVVRKAEP